MCKIICFRNGHGSATVELIYNFRAPGNLQLEIYSDVPKGAKIRSSHKTIPHVDKGGNSEVGDVVWW